LSGHFGIGRKRIGFAALTKAVVNQTTRAMVMGEQTSASTSPILELRGISKSFHGTKVLDGVDFAVRSGEVMALMGENGAGKSTLMKIVTGIYEADPGGTIKLDLTSATS
jgi:ATPase subunit of ABC transporter with duplicated ATPase domains